MRPSLLPRVLPLLLALLALVPASPSRAQEKVRYRGKLVTPEEKERLERGYVQNGDEWVLPEEARLIKKKMLRHRGRWMTVKEKEQYDKGLLPHGKKWLPGEEADALHATWHTAWELEGLHFLVRTDAGEDLGSEVLEILEAAYPRYRDFYLDRDPPKPRSSIRRVAGLELPATLLPVFVFRTQEEFGKFCREVGQPLLAEGPGFFDSATEVYATWDSGQGRLHLLSRIVGAVSELYTWYAWEDRVPRWMAEGAIRRFERMAWSRDESRLEIGLPHDSLLQEMEGKELLELDELLRGTAISVGSERRWLWGAQCWALVTFFESESGQGFAREWELLKKEYLGVPSFTDLQEAGEDQGARIFEKVFRGREDELGKAVRGHVDGLRASR